MKTIIITLLFATSSLIAQKSDYNSSRYLKIENEYNKWTIGSDKTEYFICKNTPVGIFNAYTELKLVLAYYNLSYVEPSLDNSVISSLCSDEKDWEMLSLTSRSESTAIKRAWNIEGYIVMYFITEESAFVAIVPNKK
jgi:hypothetical protein